MSWTSRSDAGVSSSCCGLKFMSNNNPRVCQESTFYIAQSARTYTSLNKQVDIFYARPFSAQNLTLLTSKPVVHAPTKFFQSRLAAASVVARGATLYKEWNICAQASPVRFKCSEQASSKDYWPTVLTWYCSKTQRHLSCFCSPALSQFWRNLSETMSMRRQKTVRMAQSDETIYSRWMNTNLQKLVNKYALLHVCPRPQLLGSVLDDKRTVTILFTLFAKRSEYMINYGCAKCQS